MATKYYFWMKYASVESSPAGATAALAARSGSSRKEKKISGGTVRSGGGGSSGGGVQRKGKGITGGTVRSGGGGVQKGGVQIQGGTVRVKGGGGVQRSGETVQGGTVRSGGGGGSGGVQRAGAQVLSAATTSWKTSKGATVRSRAQADPMKASVAFNLLSTTVGLGVVSFYALPQETAQVFGNETAAKAFMLSQEFKDWAANADHVVLTSIEMP